jgi:integrase
VENLPTASKKPKQKPSELKQPGDVTVWRQGRRHRMLASGKIMVDARVHSALLRKKIWTTHNNITEAKNWQSNQRLGRFHGGEIDPQRAKLPFAAIAAEWLVSNPSKRSGSRETDRHRLAGTGVRLGHDGEIIEKKGFAAVAVGRITSADVQRLVDTWKTTHKPSTVRGGYSTLRAVFTYAEKSRAIPKGSSPCDDIVLPALPEVQRPVLLPDDADLDEFVGVWTLSNDELIRLAEAMGPDYSLMIWIAAYLGMRWHEVAGLTVSSLDLLQGEIRVSKALDRQRRLSEPKSLAGKRFFVDRDLAPDFAAHLARRGLTAANGDALLFVNKRGRPLSYSSWRINVWLPALAKAKLDRKRNGRYLGFHDLRAMNASIMDHEGVDAKTARFRRGHASGQSGDRMGDLYTRTTPRRNRMASEKIHAVLRRQPRAVGEKGR